MRPHRSAQHLHSLTVGKLTVFALRPIPAADKKKGLADGEVKMVFSRFWNIAKHTFVVKLTRFRGFGTLFNVLLGSRYC